MSPFFSHPHRMFADESDFLLEDTIQRAEDLYDLDGETFLRRSNGRIETGSWEDGQ